MWIVCCFKTTKDMLREFGGEKSGGENPGEKKRKTGGG